MHELTASLTAVANLILVAAVFLAFATAVMALREKQ